MVYDFTTILSYFGSNVVIETIMVYHYRKLAMISGTDENRYSLVAMSLDGGNVEVIVSGKNEIEDFYYNREEQM